MVLFVLALVGCGGTPAATHPHAHGPLGRRFVEPAVEAREWDDPARDAWQKPDEVVALMAIQPGMTVADLGAGTSCAISPAPWGAAARCWPSTSRRR